MRLLVINPNTTASMTEKIGIAARRAATPGTEIVATNPPQGPVSIEGYYDEALAVPGILQTMRNTPDFDAVIIALETGGTVDTYPGGIDSCSGECGCHRHIDLGRK